MQIGPSLIAIRIESKTGSDQESPGRLSFPAFPPPPPPPPQA